MSSLPPTSTAPAAPVPPRAPPTLQTLPLEIKHMILSRVFSGAEATYSTTAAAAAVAAPSVSFTATHHLNFLMTSTQSLAENLPLFFRRCTLTISSATHSDWTAAAIARHIPAACCNNVRTLVVPQRSPFLAEGSALRELFPALRFLQLPEARMALWPDLSRPEATIRENFAAWWVRAGERVRPNEPEVVYPLAAWGEADIRVVRRVWVSVIWKPGSRVHLRRVRTLVECGTGRILWSWPHILDDLTAALLIRHF